MKIQLVLAPFLLIGGLVLTQPTSRSAPHPASSVHLAAIDTGKIKADSASFVWDDMTHGQKKEYMKTVIAKKMIPEFIKFDPKRFGEMNCSTCHGKESVKNDSFKMPNPLLPKLPSDPDSFRNKMASKKEITGFMMTKVKPEMARLLGMPEYNMHSKVGFGCFHCHTKE